MRPTTALRRSTRQQVLGAERDVTQLRIGNKQQMTIRWSLATSPVAVDNSRTNIDKALANVVSAEE
ncbi:hypothetical protein ACKUU1_20785 [Mycobacterium seoulense]|uniref:hypothetical protein n=1 Tax=Mycobacterium seoulense TaxID=386911 RepID=UPI003CEF4A53